MHASVCSERQRERERERHRNRKRKRTRKSKREYVTLENHVRTSLLKYNALEVTLQNVAEVSVSISENVVRCTHMI